MGKQVTEQVFRKTRIGSNIQHGVSIVQCAVSCASRKTCNAFNVHIKREKCIPLLHSCGKSKYGSVCYNRRADSDDGRKTRITADELIRGTTRYPTNADLTDGDTARRTEGTDCLLLFPYRQNRNSFYVRMLKLKNRKVTYFSGIGFRSIQATAFMSRSRRLIVCLGSPEGKIITFNLNNKKKTSLGRIRATALAVDEDADLIFFSDNRRIRSMSTMGKGVKEVMSTNGLVHNMLTDTRYRQLYAVSYKSILAINYATEKVYTIVTGKNLKSVAMDHKKHVLYYNMDNVLFGLWVSEMKTRRIADIKRMPLSIVYYNNSIFTSSDGKYLFLEFKGVDTGGSVKMISYGGSERRLIVCRVNILD